MRNPVLLHLGCGMKKIHGFVNVDALASVRPDSIQDVFTLPKVKPNSVDVLYACHVLEHSRRKTCAAVLARWNQVLRSGGVLRVAVPDIEAAMKWYLVHGNLGEVSGFLWGGQRNEYDHHGVGFDFNTLSELMRQAGFARVRKYDWRETEHAHVDDYSQAYLPHMDKKNGMLMSLNIEGTKP
jgi:predicted SAM-dependent methyltransferase